VRVAVMSTLLARYVILDRHNEEKMR
jgi:hypothetical protein